MNHLGVPLPVEAGAGLYIHTLTGVALAGRLVFNLVSI
jgi:hypothetical protein